MIQDLTVSVTFTLKQTTAGADLHVKMQHEKQIRAEVIVLNERDFALARSRRDAAQAFVDEEDQLHAFPLTGQEQMLTEAVTVAASRLMLAAQYSGLLKVDL